MQTMFFNMFCYLNIGKILFLGTVAEWISISLHDASRCFLPIKIHAQVFLWLGSNVPRKSISHSRLPLQRTARACFLDEGAE